MRLSTTSILVLAMLFVPVAASAATDPVEQVVDISFPVGGPTYYRDTFDAARSGGRTHQSTDIMADYGQPVYAAMSGRVTWITGLDGNPPSYGYYISVRGDDGRTYNYVHLGTQGGPVSDAYAVGMADEVRVKRGELIGFVGDSGNATGTPHLHFEIEDPDVVNEYGEHRMNPYNSLVAAEGRGDYGGGDPWDGYVPVRGDWDGDGVDTPGWFRDGRWLIHWRDRQDQPVELAYGRAGDVPVVGDWNGDGTDTVGVVRDGYRFILRYEYRSGADIVMEYGRRGDVPVAGDWNGDGTDTIGVVRGNRFILRYEYRSGADIVLEYGRDDDVPVVGDFNGDGVDTLGVVRDRQFILRYVYRSGADIVMDYGRNTDLPVIGDWDGDGVDTLGVVRDGTFITRDRYSSPYGDRTTPFPSS